MGKKMAEALRFLWRVLYPLLLYLLITSFTAALMERMGYDTWEADVLLVTAVSAGIAAIPLGILYRKEVRRAGQRSAWRPGAIPRIILAGIGGCLFFNQLIEISGLNSEAYQQVSSMLYQPPLLLQMVAIGIVIPVTEELVFRGLGYLRMKEFIPYPLAAFLSAVYFGLFHGNIVQGTYAFALGLLMAWIYHVYRSLWAPVIFHMAANIVSLLVTELIPERWHAQPLFSVMILLVSGLALCTACYQIREDGKKHEITIDSDSVL